MRLGEDLNGAQLFGRLLLAAEDLAVGAAAQDLFEVDDVAVDLLEGHAGTLANLYYLCNSINTYIIEKEGGNYPNAKDGEVMHDS